MRYINCCQNILEGYHHINVRKILEHLGAFSLAVDLDIKSLEKKCCQEFFLHQVVLEKYYMMIMCHVKYLMYYNLAGNNKGLIGFIMSS